MTRTISDAATETAATTALVQAMVRQANREIAEYNATHPRRYYVIVRPVMGRAVRYYDHHEWEWRGGEYVLVPQFQKKADPSLLMRDLDWATRIAGEIGGKVVDTLP